MGDHCQNCGSGLSLNNRFRPLRLIAEGEFGRTFQVVDKHSLHESQYLVKQFYPQNQAEILKNRINIQTKTIISGQLAIKKFQEVHRKEVQRLAKLKHPQIPTLITHFEQDGYLYLVTEFIEGENLQTELSRNGGFSESQIWQILNQLLPVLKYLHEQHIIHRDIKPENIIRPLKNKPLVLVEFDAAKLVAPQSVAPTIQNTIGTADMGSRIGTPNYMAPEQYKGREVFSSDLYSLGVTCICLLTNANPSQLFDDGSNSWKWQSRKKVSDKLGKVLNKLLELGTSNRYQSADEVIRDIASQLPGEKPPKDGAKKLKITILKKIASLGSVTQGLGGLFGVFIALGLIHVCSPSKSTDLFAKVPLPSEGGINYSKLREDLQQKDWKSADIETSELLLKIAGGKSQLRGYINYDEIQTLSCPDLKTINNLWVTASDGKLGFSVQQLIYKQQGKEWQKMYDHVGWGRLSGGNFVKTVEQELDWQTRRMRYKAGMEPIFQNPPAGHLPITASLVQGKAFPRFAEVCQF
ncbi:GUN4 domain-containing protein [Cylindrospermum sp. FACHB-282]|nr:serine/threonine-protein kinase [Cylindrospermum sp. FACHB-282]MBD2384514.1 GUN4 domain-containing protein [Cylindrospermum sp. FACHB-282]